MDVDFFRLNSLKTRLTLFTLAIFVISIWMLAFYARQVLRKEMQRVLGEQQFSTVSILAEHLNQEVDDHLRVLEIVAARVTPAMMNNPVAMQAFLEQRLILKRSFNAGAFSTTTDGVITACYPNSGNRGMNLGDRDYLVAAIKEGKATVGRPAIGKKSLHPQLVMAVPIRNQQGKVIGALAGATNLDSPNFLGKIASNSYGKTGGYTLVAPQHRLIVAATDRSRVMQPVPTPGVNPLFDRYMQGYEGYGRTVNSRGAEVLTAAKQIPAAGWMLVVRIPTQEAFAPIQVMHQRMLVGTTFLTLLVGMLTWWMLRRQLSPMFSTVEMLAVMSAPNYQFQPLPITSQDEISQMIGGFNRLLDTLRQREEALRRSESELRMLAESMPQMVWITRPDGGYIYFNQQWVEYTGLTLEESCGDGWSIPFHPEDRQLARDAWQGANQNKGTYSIECRLRRVDGTYHWWLIRGIPMLDDSGTILKWFGTCTDIDEIKQYQEDLRNKNAELESFTYTVSHDLKSPLITIQTFTGMIDQDLEEGKYSRARDDLKKIAAAAAKMSDLLRDLLKLSRVGRIMDTPSRIDMDLLVKETLMQLAGPLRQHGIEVITQPELPHVSGDRQRIAEVVQNLIENAIKHRGDQASPRIEIGVRKEGEGCVFYVSDNGAGIDPQYHDRIFDLFNKLDAKSEGSGVGLALVKRIIEVHGGRVWVESEGVGRGACFCFTLPGMET